MQSNTLNPIQFQSALGNDEPTHPVTQDVYTEDLCKFCFQTEQQSKQKLISPCSCSGSLKYVHKDCLKKWLNIEAARKEGHYTEINFGFKKPNSKCKLCEKEIVFENQICRLRAILMVFHWISIFYFMKKVKYYLCISILGSLAINYYFLKFFLDKIYSLSLKMKEHSLVSLIILSLFFILLEQTFVEVKWNSNDLELSIPYVRNK